MRYIIWIREYIYVHIESEKRKDENIIQFDAIFINELTMFYPCGSSISYI